MMCRSPVPYWLAQALLLYGIINLLPTLCRGTTVVHGTPYGRTKQGGTVLQAESGHRIFPPRPEFHLGVDDRAATKQNLASNTGQRFSRTSSGRIQPGNAGVPSRRGSRLTFAGVSFALGPPG